MHNKLSALQLVSGASPECNIETIKKLLISLSPKKNQLVLLPENALLFANREAYLTLAESLGVGVFQRQLADLAKQYSCYIICGSFPIKSEINNKIYTTSLVFSPTGDLISHYHKIHLFDALVADGQGMYKESDTFVPGKSLQLFDWQTDNGIVKVGLAICYDLRFPALFQALREKGAEVLLLPAAFTQVTGQAHWLPLLQARAVENQCYVVAANQGGLHDCGRETYGHSMVVSPWGEVLDKLEKNEGFVCAPFSKTTIDDLRTSMPISTHNRFAIPKLL
ncbi:carbon-nitrogen hydrolase family protein [Psychromonas sp. Urea-02u-13]|uniref:carbon-nitrogen hydrolase family protein n=1 Tax=Psychromonas sp. Urea-02u-13 TaxID=2058326 RepID=UPI000C326FBC|nr:carbon-nitrogen hydrolase family protein [Psychromonas sp. Urea-02u-13]PKG39650.1 carbon-nitrogen hydrolase family protein [Psychromonas sp. Urea-02u-13]